MVRDAKQRSSLLARVFEAAQRPLARLLVVDDGLGVAELLELGLRQTLVRRVHGVALDVAQLGHPVPDVLALRIRLFRLREGRKDAEAARGVSEVECEK